MTSVLTVTVPQDAGTRTVLGGGSEATVYRLDTNAGCVALKKFRRPAQGREELRIVLEIRNLLKRTPNRHIMPLLRVTSCVYAHTTLPALEHARTRARNSKDPHALFSSPIAPGPASSCTRCIGWTCSTR